MVNELKLSGYDDRKELLATRYNRAGKSLFVIALPIQLVSSHLPIPDPDVPFEGNRRVDMGRAIKFADYWIENPKWATPPLLLDTMYPLARDFVPSDRVKGVEFGIVRLPHNTAGELQVLDGQHRILGWKIAAGKIAKALRVAREDLQAAREGQDSSALKRAQTKLEACEADDARLNNEYVTLEILEGVSLTEHKQFFHDIAVNAKGITKSVTATFDQRQLLNRVAMEVIHETPLLNGRVEMEKDRVAASNENLISVKNLIDIAQLALLGSGVRMTPRREKINEKSVLSIVEGFMNLLVDSFPELREVESGDRSPASLREESLLGSPTILRVLAGAFNGLAVNSSDEDRPFVSEAGRAKVRTLFEGLAPHMGLPITDGWFDTRYFPDPASRAPSSRSQDLRGLTDLLVSWGESGEVFVK